MLKRTDQNKTGTVLFLATVLAAAFFSACTPAQASSAPAAEAVAPAPASTSFSQPKRPMDRTIDFAAAREGNPDIIAWVEVPGTVIDYPVCSTTDNVFYLDHGADREPSVGGAIFCDMSNPDDFFAPLTVLYGHYMPDESLFTQLHNYEDSGFFEKNRRVKIFTPLHQFNYNVVAALAIDDRNILYGKDYAKPADMQEFIDWIGGTKDIGANLDMEGLAAGDKFLVLSTCMQLADSDDRYIVVAKLEDTI